MQSSANLEKLSAAALIYNLSLFHQLRYFDGRGLGVLVARKINVADANTIGVLCRLPSDPTTTSSHSTPTNLS